MPPRRCSVSRPPLSKTRPARRGRRTERPACDPSCALGKDHSLLGGDPPVVLDGDQMLAGVQFIAVAEREGGDDLPVDDQASVHGVSAVGLLGCDEEGRHRGPHVVVPGGAVVPDGGGALQAQARLEEDLGVAPVTLEPELLALGVRVDAGVLVVRMPRRGADAADPSCARATPAIPGRAALAAQATATRPIGHRTASEGITRGQPSLTVLAPRASQAPPPRLRRAQSLLAQGWAGKYSSRPRSPGGGGSPCREGWRSSMAEHLFCKQVVRGSSPLVSSYVDTSRQERE